MRSSDLKALVGLAAFAGMALVLWSTHLGPGVGGDSTIYLTSAQNLAKGIGLGLIEADGSFRLLPYSAPLFPLILTPFAALDLNLTIVSRFLNIILFGGLILLAGFTSLSISQNKWWGIIPAWLIAWSPILLPVYSWAMAEPLSLLFGFSGLVLAVKNLDRMPQKKLGWLEWSGLLMGLSTAARYPAAAFLAAGIIYCVIWIKLPLIKRVVAVLRMGLVGIIPIGIWVFVQMSQTSTVSARSLLTFNETIHRFLIFWPQLNSAILVWLLPASFQDAPNLLISLFGLLPIAVLLILGWMTIRLARRFPESNTNRWISALWIFSGIYTGILLLVYLTTYPPITIDNRMLSPAYIGFIWIAGLIAGQCFELNLERPMRVALIVFIIGSIGWFGIRTIRIVRQNSQLGLGYNAVTWQQSQLIAAIKVLPETQKLVTNETMALLYLTGRASTPVAEIYSDKPLFPFTRYGDGPAGRDPAEAEFRKAGSLLVVFDTLESQFGSIYGTQAAERTRIFTEGLHVVAFGENGAMYYYPAQD